ncbi:PREDICTED: uncharacterized protein LOC104587409 [Nelumbo nucifera]|uniref:Uncharacterized protein n=2 Tax=Nelumbo nucifera TaxID=4432 RepID=A0A822XP42_NELNU|nr:PREDICTED: uncharacterized protein LOC104587409 [Nelumbo nucifera]DAD21802.1 TPA_asm: hypothetical protein HUJ06_023265 [Nelumbo nucifera]
MEKENDRVEIEVEDKPNISDKTPRTPKLKSVKTKVPEVEVHLYQRGKGPIEIFKSSLGGWDQDRLEVHSILEKYGFKSIYAFNPSSRRRSVPIRFNSKNGRSLLSYEDGSVVFIDGEPKDSMINPITKMFIGIAVVTAFIAILFKESPDWIKRFNFLGVSIPPWILACVVIVFTRLRKRLKMY